MSEITQSTHRMRRGNGEGKRIQKTESSGQVLLSTMQHSFLFPGVLSSLIFRPVTLPTLCNSGEENLHGVLLKPCLPSGPGRKEWASHHRATLILSATWQWRARAGSFPLTSGITLLVKISNGGGIYNTEVSRHYKSALSPPSTKSQLTSTLLDVGVNPAHSNEHRPESWFTGPRGKVFFFVLDCKLWGDVKLSHCV